ncbi:right-handed parallel beta-helix repeat-containing protein [Arthrobacter sp. RHLT1-20]
MSHLDEVDGSTPVPGRESTGERPARSTAAGRPFLMGRHFLKFAIMVAVLVLVWAAIAFFGTPSGTDRPGQANTGVPPGTQLTAHNTAGTDLIITEDGTVLDGLDVWGDIKIRASNVTIRNCRLRGGLHVPPSNTGIVDATDASVKGLLVEDSTIAPERPSYFRDGIVGHDYTARRNNIYGSNDGLGIFNRPDGAPAANVVAESNYIHDLSYFSNDPAHADGTHNDGIQVQGGENIRIAGNHVIGSTVRGPGSKSSAHGTSGSTAIMLQQNVAKLAGVVVENNWLDGGQSSIVIDNADYPHVTVTVRANRLGRNQFDFGNNSKYPVRIIDCRASTVTGLATNVWADTLEALGEGAAAGIRYDRKCA